MEAEPRQSSEIVVESVPKTRLDRLLRTVVWASVGMWGIIVIGAATGRYAMMQFGFWAFVAGWVLVFILLVAGPLLLMLARRYGFLAPASDKVRGWLLEPQK